MRIAFLTPEFPSEEFVEGEGLGSYVYRMAHSLIQWGHEPEVFVSSRGPTQDLIYKGIRVHRVNWEEKQPPARMLLSPWNKSDRFRRRRDAVAWIFQAKALATALERRHLEAPFALVQSADFLGVGLFVRSRQGRLNVVRCSSAADLYNDIDGAASKVDWWRSYLERLSIRRANVAYAPSRYIAQYFADAHDLDVRVIRPPRHIEIQSLLPPTTPVPNRFLFHFGQLTERKGTALLARALLLAWETAPDLAMVWSGRCYDQRKLEHWRSLWGARGRLVHITGPLPKTEIYAVLQKAEAAVLPSQVDNLPNTVIESLMFGIPVIGSRGASIDELVDDGINGHLVNLGDAAGLAQALVKMWKGESPVRKGFEWKTSIADEMRPERAVANLIALAGIKANTA